MMSPFSTHQQQLAMLAQQQSLLMAAAAKPNNLQQNGSKSMPAMNWSNASYQIPGLTQLGVQQMLQHNLQVGVGESVSCFLSCSNLRLIVSFSICMLGYECSSIISAGKLCTIPIQ